MHLKKISLKISHTLLITCISLSTYAQWSGSTINTYTAGNVGISTGAATDARLSMNKLQFMSATRGSSSNLPGLKILTRAYEDVSGILIPYANSNNAFEVWFQEVNSSTPPSRLVLSIDALGNTKMAGYAMIGSTSLPTPSGYSLYVAKGILTERLKVASSTDPINWSDFVFNKDYKLMPIHQLESFISQNAHLPEIPTANEVAKDGIDIASMDAKLLQKIEELTLYVIQQQKEIDELKKSKK